MFGSDVVDAAEPCPQTAIDFAEVSKSNDHYSKLQELEEDWLQRLEITWQPCSTPCSTWPLGKGHQNLWRRIGTLDPWPPRCSFPAVQLLYSVQVGRLNKSFIGLQAVVMLIGLEIWDAKETEKRLLGRGESLGRASEDFPSAGCDKIVTRANSRPLLGPFAAHLTFPDFPGAWTFAEDFWQFPPESPSTVGQRGACNALVRAISPQCVHFKNRQPAPASFWNLFFFFNSFLMFSFLIVSYSVHISPCESTNLALCSLHLERVTLRRDPWRLSIFRRFVRSWA